LWNRFFRTLISIYYIQRICLINNCCNHLHMKTMLYSYRKFLSSINHGKIQVCYTC
jgi:hypothetical protein